jgi:hypothetical protein
MGEIPYQIKNWESTLALYTRNIPEKKERIRIRKLNSSYPKSQNEYDHCKKHDQSFWAETLMSSLTS